MASRDALMAARGLTDGKGHLLSADGPLADLQRRCGGQIPGLIAVPELLDLVRQAAAMKLGLAREFCAYDGDQRVSGFVRINPRTDEELSDAAYEVLIENWIREAYDVDEGVQAQLSDSIDRATAEFTARLDTQQRVQAFSAGSEDVCGLAAAIRAHPGQAWTQYVALEGVAHRQPLHWRLLDSVQCSVPGSHRTWNARLLPLGGGSANPSGFELLLVAQQPRHPVIEDDTLDGAWRPSLIGEALTPALREPITRIIGNAETIRGKLAGPVRQEYSEYAGDIAAAGQHLLSLLDDLADLEAVEADDFRVDRDHVQLGEVARRAASMLSQRAQEKSITVTVPDQNAKAVAYGEFRRILQIIINLLGNAISYSPEGSSIVLELTRDTQGRVCLSVADEGPGLDSDKQDRIFNKFERLGREDEGGSGLGLYISRKLAHAMGGELLVESEEGQGARFTLALTVAD
ncbi:sensor histidine kinase [Altererythrobacter sp. GH1-8]|uniref:sensor histidine kinase n=1 Tax=Altererythrobacter sp. GH1-8 TaxID=3349333 RepID=UPI00374CA696